MVPYHCSRKATKKKEQCKIKVILQLDPCKATIPLPHKIVWVGKGLGELWGFYSMFFWNTQVMFHCCVFCCFYSWRCILKTSFCFLHATHKIHDNSQFHSAVCEWFYNSEGGRGRMQTSDCRMPVRSSPSVAFQIPLSKKQLFVELQRI